MTKTKNLLRSMMEELSRSSDALDRLVEAMYIINDMVPPHVAPRGSEMPVEAEETGLWHPTLDDFVENLRERHSASEVKDPYRGWNTELEERGF